MESIMITNVKKIWEKKYRPVSQQLSSETSQPLTLMQAFLRKTQAPLAGNDEFDAYINGPGVAFISADDVISWIFEGDNMSPSLRQQALDLLSIPAMSAELERVFSQAKLDITSHRNSLSSETIEMLELLRYWWVNNIISQQKGSGRRQRRKRKPMHVPGSDDEVENSMDQEAAMTGYPIGNADEILECIWRTTLEYSPDSSNRSTVGLREQEAMRGQTGNG